MSRLSIEHLAPVRVERGDRLAGMYMLSPYVWRERAEFSLLVRGVNHASDPRDKVSRIYAGESVDGLTFRIHEPPALSPGPAPTDIDGCEDPTVVRGDGEYVVFYSGWNEARREGSLLLARGADVHHLRKGGVVFPFTQPFQNPKEAALAQCPDSTWRLLFEYSRDGASRIGIAEGRSNIGPWTIGEDPVTPRPGAWDSWHLSPGPLLRSGPLATILVYNGATRDGRWRIGWIAFDATFSQVVDRCDGPLLVPPPPPPGLRDVAFAASLVQLDGCAWLYYSVADQDLFRATIIQS